MIRDFVASDLLHCADQLAGRSVGPGRPRTAYLRRATSTAYYALFHHLGHAAARQVASPLAGADLDIIRRWITHTELKRVSLWFTCTGQAPVNLRALVTQSPSSDLSTVATAVIDLQQARHSADYDPKYNAQKSQTLWHIDQARAAVSAATELESTDDADYQRYLFLVMSAALAKNG